MATISVSDKKITTLSAQFYVFMCDEKNLISSELKAFAAEHDLNVKALFADLKFSGKSQQVVAIPFNAKNKTRILVCAGLGDAKKGIAIETYRRALARAYRKATEFKCESMAIQLPSPSMFGITAQELGKETVVTINLTGYHFNEYITDKERKGCDIEDITLVIDAKHKKGASEGVKIGDIIGHAVNSARHWIDLPPSDLTPPQLADKGLAIAKKHGLKSTVFDEKQINKMGMGGLAGVSRGSDVDCRLLVLEYTAKKKNAPTLAFVGKGITFDSGGLSLKPATYMENMKDDMSGAAAVIATMQALAQLKPDVNIIAVTPLSENLPSGKATKPGDILRFYNGKTAEVRNTDAEGRLVLADALSYVAKEYEPDAIIDLATLTGACAAALGPFHTGMMSEHDDLVKKVQKAADSSGDRVWRLPMGPDYRVAIRSSVADICNIGSSKYMAGAITAAHFLQNFVDDIPWVHLDIAGSSFDVPDIPYFRPGATGVGVRLLVDLAMNWK